MTYLAVGADGLVDPEAIGAALTDKTILISVMLANNEIGTVQDIAAIGKLAKEKGIVFHTDATQAVGKVPVDVEAMGIDLLSSTSHMLYGPKGVGALYVRRKGPRVRLAPMIDGGGHERGMRSGTVPVPLAVGFGRAAEICRELMPDESKRLAGLRDRPRTPSCPGWTRRSSTVIPSAAAAPQPQHFLRLCRGRVGADGAQQGSGAVLRLCLHVVDPRTSYVISALG